MLISLQRRLSGTKENLVYFKEHFCNEAIRYYNPMKYKQTRLVINEYLLEEWRS